MLDHGLGACFVISLTAPSNLAFSQHLAASVYVRVHCMLHCMLQCGNINGAIRLVAKIFGLQSAAGTLHLLQGSARKT